MELTNKIMHLLQQIKYPFLVFILLSIQLIYTHYSVVTDKGELTTFAYLENLGTTLIDAGLLLFLPFLFINKRKYIYILFFILIDIFLLTNIWYSRNFHAYFPLSLITEYNNLQGLTNNILVSISFLDLIIPFTSILTLLIIYHKFQPNISLKNRLITSFTFFSTSFILITIFFALIFLRSSTPKEKFIMPYAYTPLETTFRHGVFYYFFIQTWNSSSQHYSEEELLKLEPLFNAQSTEIIPEQNKNIIIIIIESLLSFANDLNFNGQEITPNLNQLKKENTYYNRHVIPQTQLGESSDGQFIYFIGLLPLKNTVTIIYHLKNKYTTFPSLLKQQDKIKESHMTIPTGPTYWRQDNMCQRYQIDSLFSRNDYPRRQARWLNDEEIFKLAQSKDIKMPQPFLSIILTASTHSPYDQSIEENTTFKFPDEYSKELQNYLINVHYTDRQIGNYIHFLKQNQLYDNSIIVITSDHEAHSDFLNLPLSLKHITHEIPLYIINTPIEITKSSHDTIQQIDIFPTLLDLTGIQSSWRGVGRSLLMSDSIANSTREKERRKNAQKISDIIIHSDYFKTQESNTN